MWEKNKKVIIPGAEERYRSISSRDGNKYQVWGWVEIWLKEEVAVVEWGKRLSGNISPWIT